MEAVKLTKEDLTFFAADTNDIPLSASGPRIAAAVNALRGLDKKALSFVLRLTALAAKCEPDMEAAMAAIDNLAAAGVDASVIAEARRSQYARSKVNKAEFDASAPSHFIFDADDGMVRYDLKVKKVKARFLWDKVGAFTARERTFYYYHADENLAVVVDASSTSGGKDAYAFDNTGVVKRITGSKESVQKICATFGLTNMGTRILLDVRGIRLAKELYAEYTEAAKEEVAK